MTNSRIALIVIGLLLIAQATTPPSCLGDKVKCTGKYKGGLAPTSDELQEILKQHDAWVKNGGPDHMDDPKVANDRRRANLCDANLKFAHLSGVDLEGADLDGAILDFAYLECVYLGSAHLECAYLDRADLSGAHLSYAHLSGAVLWGADLSSADLSGAHLNGADLWDANLSDSKLEGVDLANAYVDFDTDTLPKISPGIASALNLELVKFHDEPAALVKVRKEFKDLGLRTQESQLTYAIRRAELQRKRKDSSGQPTKDYALSRTERVFNTVFFDWTCQYGMSPGRPLLIVAALALIMPLVYIFAQVSPGPNGGIWAVWDEHRIKQVEGTEGKPEQLIDGFPGAKSDYSFLLLAYYFSLLSATRIGWHELNVGTWITRIQPREYSLRATGWVRVVSGIQSLISVYLVALAILTYFGTPFEY